MMRKTSVDDGHTILDENNNIVNNTNNINSNSNHNNSNATPVNSTTLADINECLSQEQILDFILSQQKQPEAVQPCKPKRQSTKKGDEAIFGSCKNIKQSTTVENTTRIATQNTSPVQTTEVHSGKTELVDALPSTSTEETDSEIFDFSQDHVKEMYAFEEWSSDISEILCTKTQGENERDSSQLDVLNEKISELNLQHDGNELFYVTQ